jgi:hypothetical protein
MARKRFNRNAVCRADGNSGIYEASHKAHRDALHENHKNAIFLMIETNNTKVEIKSNDSEITIRVWGKPMKINREIAKAAGFIK